MATEGDHASAKPERATSKASKRARSQAQGSRRKLAEHFLSDLERSWRLYGREMLGRLGAERPEFFFRMMVKVALVQLGGYDKLSDLDRQQNREQALHRLEQSTRTTISFPR